MEKVNLENMIVRKFVLWFLILDDIRDNDVTLCSP